jgi:DNA-binding IclR family transcriptional regulator
LIRDDEDIKTPYRVPALANGLAVLALFTREQQEWTAPDIAQVLSLPRSTAFRILQTLESLDYVRRDHSGRLFRLGSAVLNRGFAYLSSLDIVEVAQPILKKLRDDTGLSSHLAVREGREVLYVARFAARSSVASSVTVGSRFPVHATVLGRMLILDFTDEQLNQLYPESLLAKITEQTPATKQQLRDLLEQDKQRGYAVSQSFFERGVSAIAAPVRDASGQVIAALNITAVDPYVRLEDMQGALKDRVIDAAAEMRKWLFSEESVVRCKA